MPKLSSNQLQEYNDNSHVAPIKVLTKDQAYVIRKKLIPTCKKKIIQILQEKEVSSFFKKKYVI